MIMIDSLTYTKLPLGYRLLAYMGLMYNDPNRVYNPSFLASIGARIQDLKETERVRDFYTGEIVERQRKLSSRELGLAVCNTLLAKV